MKKTLLICVMILTVLLTPISASATMAAEDAFTIDAETRAMLSVSEEDTVVRIYLGYFMYGLSLEQPMETLFNDGWSVRYTMYVIVSEEEDGTQSFRTTWEKDGQIKDENTLSNTLSQSYRDNVHEYNLELYELCNDTERILGVLGPNVTANKTVCMNGYRHDDLFIYYETNIGDYIYYKPIRSTGAEEFLVPLAEFREYAKVVTEHRKESVGGGNGTADYDLSPYNLSNYTASHRRIWSVVLLCGIPALLVIGGGVWFIMRKKTRE